MSAQPEPERLTWAEYLKFEAAYLGDERFELTRGQVLMMSGGTEQHDLLVLALYRSLYEALLPCRTFVHNRKVRTGATSGFYPDLLVRCGETADPLYEDDARFVIEVLSPSNGPADQIRRLDGYRSLRSIESILFVDPTRHVVTIHRRLDGVWRESQTTDGSVVLGAAVLDVGGLWAD